MAELVSYAEVWYKRKPTFRSDPGLDAGNLELTHVYVHNVQVDLRTDTADRQLDHVFQLMQGECWSNVGQAKRVLARRGVHHTSMSVGDVVVMPNDTAWECTDMGWRNIGKLHVVRSFATMAGR